MNSTPTSHTDCVALQLISIEVLQEIRTRLEFVSKLLFGMTGMYSVCYTLKLFKRKCL